MNAVTATAFVYDPFDKAVMDNPLPFYQVLRAEHPVYYIDKYDMFVFSRFDDVAELLAQGNNTFIASEQTLPSPEVLTSVRHTMPPRELDMDPLPRSSNLGSPWYEQLRQAQIKPLQPRGVAAIRDLVRKLANDRLDVLLPQRAFDLTQEYGGVVAGSVVCHLFGLDPALAPQVRDAVNAVTVTDPEKGGVDLAKLLDAVLELIRPAVERRRAAGANGDYPLIDGLLAYRINGRPLTDHEVAMQLVCVFVGGTETVPKITAHGLLELVSRPDQLAAVRADLASTVPQVVEEMIRYCAPAQWFARLCHKDTIVAGQKIRAGQRVLFLLGSAARDEREFDRPDAFIWNRTIKRVVSFGLGQHHCIGAHLARMELRVLIHEFLARVPEFTFDLEQSVRYPSSFQWGWNSLHVRIGT